MNELAKRLASLSSSQRELLARRLEKNSPKSPSPETTTVLKDAGRSVDFVENPPSYHDAIEFSLLFFSDEGAKEDANRYRLLFESAKFADEHGFAAIWTPERHFQEFGGLYPNPSVLSAALAMVTKRIQIRAGSVALPLHNPIRVAEEWSLVDNLSGGRVGVSFASGWHTDDFVFAPAAYHERKKIMFDDIEKIKKLWAGEAVTFNGVDTEEVEVKILPKPVQRELPIWITSSGSRETWIKAGEIGANILSGFKGEPEGELGGKIALYREARKAHGHDPQAGCVTIMAHVFIGDDNDAVRERVRTPLTRYLRTFIKQGDRLNFKELGVETRGVSDGDKDALASFAFERFFNTGPLLGTPHKCRQIIDRLQCVGVNEIAALVDFGLDEDSVMKSLGRLNELRGHYQQSRYKHATA